MKTLKLILGDQLNSNHSWFQKPDSNITLVLMEVLQETNYVKHHIQKVVCFFAAMRNFADFLVQQNHQVIYIRLDNPENKQNFTENLDFLIQKHQFEHFEYLYPDEFRLDEILKNYAKNLLISSKVSDTEHFLTERNFLSDFFKGKKTYLLETFYRFIRQKHSVLMNGKEPIGEKWNFDAENRKKYDGKIKVPKAISFEHDLTEIYEMLQKFGVQTIGFINPKKVNWTISRTESLEWLEIFCQKFLQHFGTFQDAMHSQEPFLFHSKLSFALNIKLLHPLEVVNRAVLEWEKNPEKISLAQIEGFIRQIIGWREYMRGIYWAKMPEFAQTNYFQHQNSLPKFYWTGKTKMNCLKNAITNSLENAYAHHIQRLMITGNFALLAGVNPDEVDEWYLGIYIDAIEWVEITNTRGMSQFADGGWVGSKPYVASANYISKMSNYCENCVYDKNLKYGKNACPFNSLYWDFYHRNSALLEKNARIGMMYQTLKKMDTSEKQKILQQAQIYLNNIEDL